VDLRSDVGMKSTGDDLAGSERITFATSSTVTAASSSSRHAYPCALAGDDTPVWWIHCHNDTWMVRFDDI